MIKNYKKIRTALLILVGINVLLVISMFNGLLSYSIESFVLKVLYIEFPLNILGLFILRFFNKKEHKSIDYLLIALGIFISALLAYLLFYLYEQFNNQLVDYKPIIYLYPKKEENVSVRLGYKDNLLVSYPEYNNGWDVVAYPNGDLKEIKSNKNLYSLYYESNNEYDFKVLKEGFVVKGEETTKFLEEKLSILGLNDHEKEEFIIYWLPILKNNKYNYIRFASLEEINKNMPLEVNPKPDTLIRVLMVYKALDNKIDVKAQVLNSVSRDGFVCVEWGGTEIK